MEVLLVAVLALALVCLSLVHASYRATHKHSLEAVKRERQDAVNRSRGVRHGKALENLGPLVPAFAEKFSPNDARFMGGPIDFVVFDGLDAGNLRCVVLVEVKTGSGRLSGRERQVQRAVDEGRIGYEVVRLG